MGLTNTIRSTSCGVHVKYNTRNDKPQRLQGSRDGSQELGCHLVFLSVFSPSIVSSRDGLHFIYINIYIYITGNVTAVQ